MRRQLLIIAVLAAFLAYLHAQNESRQQNLKKTFFTGHLIRVDKTASNGTCTPLNIAVN
jgi:hypothetical protein